MLLLRQLMASEADSERGTILDNLQIRLTHMHTVAYRVLVTAHEGRKHRRVVGDVCLLDREALPLEEPYGVIEFEVQLRAKLITLGLLL